jgi:hypothetical protein
MIYDEHFLIAVRQWKANNRDRAIRRSPRSATANFFLRRRRQRRSSRPPGGMSYGQRFAFAFFIIYPADLSSFPLL